MRGNLPAFLLLALLSLASLTESQYYLYEGYEESPEDEVDEYYDPSTDDGSGPSEPDYYFHNDDYDEDEDEDEDEDGEYDEDGEGGKFPQYMNEDLGSEQQVTPLRN